MILFYNRKIPLHLFAVLIILLSSTSPAFGFGVLQRAKSLLPIGSMLYMAEGNTSDESIENDKTGQEAVRLKNELLDLADRTKRGFQASAEDRKKAKELIFDLARLNPTPEPASPYYSSNDNRQASSSPTLAGKWTLVYTDAPDITGLDTSRNPFSTAKLGRIGQECNPPYIKNVIEWLRPDWAKNLPFSGSDETRVLQKIVTSASANPNKPLTVDLKVAGLELEAGATSGDEDDSIQASDLVSLIQKRGIPAGLLSVNPVDLKGPLNPPFGQFEILYVDEDFRMIKTYQNFLAVNQRIKSGEEWF